MSAIQTVVVGGVKTKRLSRQDMILSMAEDCVKAREKNGPCKLVFDLNGHGLALSRWNDAYRRDLSEADIIHADGQAVVLASRLLTRSPIPERSATSDLFHDAAAYAARNGCRFYLLGGTEEVNARCEIVMKKLYPELEIVGRRDGFFIEADEACLCENINRLNVDVLWVGLGKPKEQAFCVRNKHRLNVGWAVTCGGCFNYVVGEYPRAPQWMQNAGLEWLHRLATRPRQMLWRYLTTNPVAMYMLLTRTRTTVIDANI
ncbi:WecB/TagA/CpsF family glycosyltransferase [Methylocapsa sp. D3K7]|jgi:N-acetylglucosaminyldiphosphoundecaprenol N-acetyl-beta-D-mannosaminyltransferase|uniref:WecB/TagA/CpsF family glycosyltransferase n=1 Tax=Methylocapsa sp. D3K7 TaxID=3041435 RepID=UPI00244E6D38|nr:WecB/TagA/CpsF family glycosyltransferase [Methylocapsa sp. D3K7]WGJ14170.1 WecB/TagA/CpsF family glycosyltransferase [Methylocapsa sp. D3K7]